MLIPHRFLFRLSLPCLHVPGIPDDDDDLFHLPDECRLETFADLDGKTDFADVRLAWNEGGVALELEIRGKEQLPVGDVLRPRSSDGITLWLDTRDTRAGHRAGRSCHQFHFLAAGGGEDKDQPVWTQSKIHRALGDAPFASASAIAFRCKRLRDGYRLAAWLPASVLHGYDPEENPKLGVFYAVRDAERGEQTLGAATDLPYAEDPSLWAVLELKAKEE